MVAQCQCSLETAGHIVIDENAGNEDKDPGAGVQNYKHVLLRTLWGCCREEAKNEP